MDLALMFDHRFYRDTDGIIFSAQNYNYPLFKGRYLQVFDNIRIFTRLLDKAPRPRGEDFVEGDGVKIIPLGDWEGPLQFGLSKPKIMRRLVENLPGDSAVMMISPGVLGFAASALLRKQGRPYGVEVVGDPVEVFAPGVSRHPLRAVFQRWFAQNMRLQCAGASGAAYVNKTVLPQRYPAPKDAFVTNYSSIELRPEAFASAPRVYSDVSRQIRLVTVGSLAQMYKAPDVLIDAVAQCVEQGLDLHVTFIGDGQYRGELEQRVRTRGLTNNVVFLGQLSAGEAVREQLVKADIFVLPSRTEGLPRSMIEAMACGLPCIGSTAGGIPELLPAEDMVAPGDAPGLAQLIGAVVTNPQRMTAASQRNMQVAADYRFDILQERRLNLYRHIEMKTGEWLQKK